MKRFATASLLPAFAGYKRKKAEFVLFCSAHVLIAVKSVCRQTGAPSVALISPWLPALVYRAVNGGCLAAEMDSFDPWVVDFSPSESVSKTCHPSRGARDLINTRCHVSRFSSPFRRHIKAASVYADYTKQLRAIPARSPSAVPLALTFIKDFTVSRSEFARGLLLTAASHYGLNPADGRSLLLTQDNV